MPRPPKARLLILRAAERIVQDRGAANLTFEELTQESGISRGGICYHFATKEDLLRALIAQDMAQWEAQEQQCRLKMGADAHDLIAELRTMTEAQPEKRRFVAGMMSAVAHDRSLLEPVRQHEAERAPKHWTEAEIDCQILRLAAGGLFWADIFGCMEIPPEQRRRVVERLEELARQWYVPAPPPTPSN